MVDWKLHLLSGSFMIISWLTFFYFFKIFEIGMTTIVILGVLTLFSSLFPDIDMKKSKIRDVISMILSLLVAVIYIYRYPAEWFYGIAYFVVLYFLFRSVPTKHHGITHTYRFALVFSLVLVFFVYFLFGLNQIEFLFWLGVIFLSYSTHLMLDGM